MRIKKIIYALDETDRKSIKKQMVDKDLTLTRVAQIIGVSKAYLSEILAGNRTVTPRIIKQFEMCGIEIEMPKNCQYSEHKIKKDAQKGEL